MEALLSAVMPALLKLAEVLAGLLAAYLAARVTDLIATRAKNAKVRDILLGLETVAADAVAEVWQTSVEAAKKASADGRLPRETAEAAKAAAVATVKSYLGAKGLEALCRALGIGQADADRVISNKIEKAISEAKRRNSNRIAPVTVAH